MKRIDPRHPNNDCKVWSQLDRWQMEVIEQIKDDAGKTESEIVRRLLVGPLNEYQNKRKAVMSKVEDELKNLL